MTSSQPAPNLNVCTLGRHGSGKTTYLGALWSVLRKEPRDDDVEAVLDGPLPERTAYLDAAAHALEGGERVDRTNRGTGEDIVLQLQIGNRRVQLNQLDVAGETIEQALKSRAAPATLVERLRSADAVMLFINPSDITLVHTISEARALERAAGGDPPPHPTKQEPPDDATVTDEQIWENTPTAVQLVDLLQVATQPGRIGQGVPIAVMISGWENIDPSIVGQTASVIPLEWMWSRLPLLAQFLVANAAAEPFAVFGVSAQGGDYEDPAVVQRLAILPVADRVRVSDGTSVTRNLARPLQWLVEHV